MITAPPLIDLTRLEASFVATVTAHSNDPNKKAVLELANEWWGQIVHMYRNRRYHNLGLIQQSLDMLPNFIKNSTADMPYVVVAFILQWIGPSINPENNYPYYKLTTVYKWPEYKARLVQSLARIRLDLEIPNFAPQTTMYDLNLIRFGVGENEFLQNQELALKERHATIGMGDFLNMQESMFNYLLKRGQIFSTQSSRDQYEARAISNIKAYLSKIGRLKEKVENAKLALTS